MIVVFGSLIADLVFPVESLPRPGETVAAPGVLVVPGGKGANQAVAAARTGSRVRMVGSVGDDVFGNLLMDGLVAAGVDIDLIAQVATATGCAAVCVDADGQNQIVIALGANAETHADQIADALLGEDTIVVVQMEIAREENWKLVRRARAKGARVLLNAAPGGSVPEDTLRAVDTILVNEIEAVMLCDAVGLDAGDPVAAGRALRRQFGTDCVVTLGGAGAVAFLGDAAWRFAALPVVAVDATAAGDAFAGVFASSLDAGIEVIEALRRASIAGGLACTATGAQPSLPTGAEIAARLAELPNPSRL